MTEFGGRIFEGDSKTSYPIAPVERYILPNNSYLVREDNKSANQVLEAEDPNNKFEITDESSKGERYTLHRGNPYPEKITELEQDLRYYKKGLITRGYESIVGETLNPSQKYHSAVNALHKDSEMRTAGSMNNAIDSFRNLGMATENIGMRALSLQMLNANWNETYKAARPTYPEGKLLDHRANAILSMATAETTLQHGLPISKSDPGPGLVRSAWNSLFDNDTSSAVPKERVGYILSDKQLDLGGFALAETMSARRSIELAKSETTKQLGTKVDGTLVDESENEDLDKVVDRIDALHDKIQGKHDIAGAVDELAKYIKEDKVSHLRPIMNLSKSIEDRINQQGRMNKSPERSEYLAKLLRDQATVKMALGCSSDEEGLRRSLFGAPADNGTGVGAQTYKLTGAEGCINLARAIDPSNMQNADFSKLFDKLKRTIK